MSSAPLSDQSRSWCPAMRVTSHCPRCRPVPARPRPLGVVTGQARLSYVTVSAGAASAGPWQSWTGWLAYLSWPRQATSAAAVTTLTTHACGTHVVRVDTWRADPPLRVDRGQLIASLFVVAIMDAGRPELADLSPGIDRLGWRIAEWRSTSTMDCLELTVVAGEEALTRVHGEMATLVSRKGEIVTIPAIGRRPW